ncbi:hypothetical protein H4582DRAFT_2064873 [Lactarius indigo]|nr:hypothetical protein H4582DRAFT_2064873 [Lactarius indigo]
MGGRGKRTRKEIAGPACCTTRGDSSPTMEAALPSCAPFPRKRGAVAMGEGAVCPHLPLLRKRGAAATGKGSGGGSSCAPLPRKRAGAAMGGGEVEGDGERGGRQPPLRDRGGGAATGKEEAGGVPSRLPFPRKGADVPSCAPFPREWCGADGVAWAGGEREGGGIRCNGGEGERGGGWRRKGGGGGGAYLRAPPFRANGTACPCAHPFPRERCGAGWRRREEGGGVPCGPSPPPLSAQMERRGLGAKGGGRVQRGEERGGEARGGEAHALVRPLSADGGARTVEGGEREGGNVPLCPPAPPFSVQRGGGQRGDRGKGRGKRREEGGEGGGGGGREGALRSLHTQFHTNWVARNRTGEDKGGAMGGKSLGGERRGVSVVEAKPVARPTRIQNN